MTVGPFQLTTKSADYGTSNPKMEQTIREVDIYCLGSFQNCPDSVVLGMMDALEEVLLFWLLVSPI